MKYYAATYPHGLAVHANTGLPLCTYARFNSKRERDEWVANGGGYRTMSDWREKVFSKDPDLKKFIRNQIDRGMAWVNA